MRPSSGPGFSPLRETPFRTCSRRSCPRRTPRISARIAGDLNNVANQASHRERYRAALAAAQSSIRLGRKSREREPTFLSGAYYTEAMVILKGGNPELALEKAEALLDLCQGADDSPIRQATQHLIAEIRRTSGDSQAAVELARQALASARGDPENVAMAKGALARALNDNGQTEEALEAVKQAWALLEHSDIPPEGQVEILSLITSYASQLGKRAILLSAMDELKRVPGKSAKVKEEKEQALARVKAFTQLRKRLTTAGTLRRKGGRTVELPDCQSLAEANAAVVRPLLGLWDGFGLSASDALAGMYDFWGRGNFERLLHNAKRFPHSFNITLEVRSLDDVKRAVRLWGLYADFLLLLWKGPTDNGMAIVPVPEGYEGPGGWGYMVCYGDVLDVNDPTSTWHPALGYSSMFPADVAAFLATEARPFLEAGRLIVVPAVGAGCVNPGHGPFEQLLAEAANAIPSVRWKGVAGTPIGLVPHSPDAPFALLAELAETEAARLRKLRLLLLRRSQQLRPDGGIELEAKMLSLEIDDALRDFEDRGATFARKGYARAKEPVEAAFARFKEDGRRLSDPDNASPFAPLMVLQSLGYGWRVDSPHVPHLPPRFEPERGDVVGTWLAPPTAGWTIPVGRRLAPSAQR